MSFVENLILGLAGVEIIESVDRLHDQRSKEREQRRRDSLFWQESIRTKNPCHDYDKDPMDDGGGYLA